MMSYELSELFNKTIQALFGADNGAAQYSEYTFMDGDQGGFMYNSSSCELKIHMVFFKGKDYQLDRAYKSMSILKSEPFKEARVIEYQYHSNDIGDIAIDATFKVRDSEALLKEMDEFVRVRWEKDFLDKVDDICTT